jgi:hypothetical protein
MPTPERQQAAAKLQEFADFLRDEYLDPDHFDGWPGLPVPTRSHSVQETMPRAERAGVDLYLLGCSVDMNEHTWRVWSGAQNFYESVPASERPRLWEWISKHPPNEWNNRRPKLHRYTKRHAKIHCIAQTLVKKLGGDPRKVWEDHEGSKVLSVLEDDLQLGPQISRMTLGGLRDHKLVQMRRSPFKSDVWVCRAVKALKLSPTERPVDVERAGEELFDDPWSVDGALWELGKDCAIKDLSDFKKYYDEMASWKRIRTRVQPLVKGMIDELSAGLGSRNGWALQYDPTPHWAGIYLVRTEGPLEDEMGDIQECEMWAWVGVGWYKTLVIAVDVGGHPTYLTDTVLQLCRSTINRKEERQTSSGRWGMREFYHDEVVGENKLLDRDWLLRNLTIQLELVQKFVRVVESGNTRAV